MTNASPDNPDRRQWGPPPDSDLIGIPLLIGLVVVAAAVVAAFVFVGMAVGMIALLVVLVLALAVSYRIVSDSDPKD